MLRRRDFPSTKKKKEDDDEMAESPPLLVVVDVVVVVGCLVLSHRLNCVLAGLQVFIVTNDTFWLLSTTLLSRMDGSGHGPQ